MVGNIKQVADKQISITLDEELCVRIKGNKDGNNIRSGNLIANFFNPGKGEIQKAFVSPRQCGGIFVSPMLEPIFVNIGDLRKKIANELSISTENIDITLGAY